MRIKLFLVLIFLCGIILKVHAATPFSQIVRNDGVIINKCIDDFGKIDYCTVYDRNNANTILKNSKKYSIKEEILIDNNILINNSLNTQNQVIGQTTNINSKSNARTFGESCMNIQYAVGTGSTLINTIINTIDSFKR